jgi:hypothetical protein
VVIRLFPPSAANVEYSPRFAAKIGSIISPIIGRSPKFEEVRNVLSNSIAGFVCWFINDGFVVEFEVKFAAIIRFLPPVVVFVLINFNCLIGVVADEYRAPAPSFSFTVVVDSLGKMNEGGDGFGCSNGRFCVILCCLVALIWQSRSP